MVSQPFHTLCEAHCLHHAAILAQPQGSLRGLFTATTVRAGDPVLAVPWELTLAAEVQEDISAHEDGVAPHHVAVATELLAATQGGASFDDQQRFWVEWVALLPQPSELPHPATLEPELLARAQDAELAASSLSRRQRVAAALSAATPHENWSHWAFAMVSSRPFLLAPPATLDVSGQPPPASPPIFAFVPFIDMANHEAAPSCEVRAVSSGRGGYEAVELVALRDLEAGEEATISYDLGGLTSARVFGTFGFVDPNSFQHDRLPKPPPTYVPLSRTALNATLHSLASPPPMLAAVWSSLPHTAPPDNWRCAGEADAAARLLDWMHTQTPTEFVTTLSEDLVALDALAGDATGVEATVLRYRVGRKRLWVVAEEVLTSHVRAHEDCVVQGDSAAPGALAGDVPSHSIAGQIARVLPSLLLGPLIVGLFVLVVIFCSNKSAQAASRAERKAHRGRKVR
uniref:SET domain-containing protein n=1 Tax=Haptolina ericina TaxID=156174 RepID=A0A7S3F2R2_9EUKA|mmetsp:Transcript_49989/g.112353  ORF Transcript_49989/g.112353 Transcript_49989/m.112353 type:complete len:457 (+) Transcript_49989:153-1523(+)